MLPARIQSVLRQTMVTVLAQEMAMENRSETLLFDVFHDL